MISHLRSRDDGRRAHLDSLIEPELIERLILPPFCPIAPPPPPPLLPLLPSPPPRPPDAPSSSRVDFSWPPLLLLPDWSPTRSADADRIGNRSAASRPLLSTKTAATALVDWRGAGATSADASE